MRTATICRLKTTRAYNVAQNFGEAIAMPKIKVLHVTILFLSCLPGVCHGQAVYGSIFGTVTDSSGAIIPGATVTVVDVAKGISVEVHSGNSGEYTVSHLIPDVYDVKVTSQGFKTSQTTGIQVFADTSQKVEVALIIGGENTTVEVSGDSVPLLKTDRADVSTVFDTKTVEDLPIGDRNFTNIQLLLPGAQPLAWSHAASENPQQSKQIQVDGQAFGGVGFQLDGTDNQDPILGIIVINPALDSVSETKIATQNFDAEFGMAVSSIMTAQTKSGSNRFHGSLFDYRQSNANLAVDPYTQYPAPGTTSKAGVIPSGLRNQFGGSLGGPVLKNKLFFFGDYQGWRQRVGTSATSTIPTALLTDSCLGIRTGPSGIPGCDFSDYANAGGPGNGLIYQQPTKSNGITATSLYRGNVIPAALVSPQWIGALKLLQPYSEKATPVVPGTLTGIASNYSTSGQGTFNNDQWDERADYTVNKNLHTFERFSRFTDALIGAQIFGPAGGPGTGLNGYGGNSRGHNDSLAIGADYVVTPSVFADFRLGYYRYNIGNTKNDQGVPFATNLGIPGLNTGDPSTGGAPDFNVYSPGVNGGHNFGDGLSVSNCNCPLTEREDQFQLVTNWTKSIGTHSLKFGADLRYARNLRVPSDENRTGVLTFANGPTSNPALANSGGNGWATFALGQVSSFNRFVSTSTNAKEFQKRDFFYAQDTWRATPKLTINYGLRYEIYFPESGNGKGNSAMLDLTTGYIPVAGYGNTPSNLGWNKASNPIAPRIGIAYQADPKTVVRLGYGRSFDMGIFGAIFGYVITGNIPVLANQIITPPSGPATNYAFCLGPNQPGCDSSEGASGVPSSGGPAEYQNIYPINSDGKIANPGYAINSRGRPTTLRLPTLDAWNLSLQHAFTPTLSVTMAYVGNKGTHTINAGDNGQTDPSEPGLLLPAQYSITGQALHWDPSPSSHETVDSNGIGVDGGTNSANFLRRYYGGTLPACQDPTYATPTNEPGIKPGMCGWTAGITYQGNDQDNHFNALQVSVAKQLSHGLQLNANYAWQVGYDFASSFSTWSRKAVKGRNNDIREQQLTVYGLYQLPFGQHQAFASHIPKWADEAIGGWELSPVISLGSGEPFTLTYNECNLSVGGTSAPCYPNGRGGNLKTHLNGLNTVTHTRTFYQSVVPAGHNLCDGGSYSQFTCPGLDQIGDSGRNNVFGPGVFNTDLSLQKNFPIRESLSAQLRMDAFNAFNIVSAGNPGGGGGSTSSIETEGLITSGSGSTQNPGYAPGLAPRQLQFSLRVQF